VRLVQRRQRHQLGECLDHTGVDPRRLGEFGATVNHAVPEGDDRPAGQKLAAHLHDLGGGGMVVERAAGPSAFRHHGACRVHRLEMGCLPDALDLAAEQQGAVVAGFVQRELDARRAGVEDSDAIGHDSSGDDVDAAVDIEHIEGENRALPNIRPVFLNEVEVGVGGHGRLFQEVAPLLQKRLSQALSRRVPTWLGTMTFVLRAKSTGWLHVVAT
jgi:hypothetical protein